MQQVIEWGQVPLPPESFPFKGKFPKKSPWHLISVPFSLNRAAS